MKVIKKPTRNTTIIEPTENPKPQDVIRVATSLIAQTQACLLNPSAVIAALACAYDLYTENARKVGLEDQVIADSMKAGVTISEAAREAGLIRTKSTLSVPESGLVGPDGQPLR